jgi:thiol-disulfide isomerase/thioredoxin
MLRNKIRVAVTVMFGIGLITAASFAGQGCGMQHSGDNAMTSSSSKNGPAASQKTVLFFMNPNGRPCQMQDAILGQIKDSLAGCATVRYIKTTLPADRALFGKYGIRGLPSLIITGNDGKELHRFTPGIQSTEIILAALKESNK